MGDFNAVISEAGYRDAFKLEDIRIYLESGGILLIYGPSGSGKTTLLRCLTRTIERARGYFRGRVEINGEDIYSLPLSYVYKKISYIPQEPWYGLLGYTVDVEIEIALSQAGVDAKGLVYRGLEVERLLPKLTYNLSAGEVQRVLWLEALGKGSEALVLDEPMVYLDYAGKSEVRKYVEKALSEGRIVIVVDHDPSAWEGLDPDILVLQNGRALYQGKTRDLPPFKNEEGPGAGRARGSVMAEGEGIWFKYPGDDYILRGISFVIYSGVITGFIGRNGSGKTTLLKIVGGILRPTKGKLARRGKFIYIPENTITYFTKPLPAEELLYSASRAPGKNVEDVIDMFNLRDILNRPLARLSSGERRRLAIASAYLAGYDGYLVDEPTGGLDTSNAAKVIEALEELASNGKAVVIASHDERLLKRIDEKVFLGGVI